MREGSGGNDALGASNATPTLILVVTAGVGVPSDLRFPPGEAVESVSLGRRGSWFFDAAGVRDIHAHLTFDGERLLYRSETQDDAATIDGMAAPNDWIVLVAPCTLGFGSVRIEVTSTANDHDSTFVQSTPTTGVRPPVSRIGPSARMMFPPAGESSPTVMDRNAYPDLGTGDDSEDATRIDPILPTPTAESVLDTRPKAPLPSTAPLPPVRPPMDTIPSERHLALILAAGTASGARAAANGSETGSRTGTGPAGAKAPAMGDLAAQWKTASFPKKALVCLMPFALVATWFVFDEGDRTSTAPPSQSPSQSQTQVRPTADGAAPKSSAAAVDGPRDASGPVVVIVAPNGVPITDGAATTQLAPASASTAKPAATSASNKTAPKDPSQKTVERVAIDAVAAGSYTEAARLYDDLASNRPDKPAFHEAARILRSKTTTAR